MKKLKVLFLSEVPLIKYGLKSGFDQLGHETYYMHGLNSLAFGCPDDEQIRRLERVIEEFKPDLAFTEGYGGCNIRNISFILQKHSIPFVFWAIEDPVTTGLSMYYAPFADFIFTTTMECLDMYRRINKPCGVMLFACNPEFHKTVEQKQEYKLDIAIAASNYSNRYDRTAEFIMPFLKTPYDIGFWGLCWDDFTRPTNLKGYMDKYHGVLPYEELPSLYSSCKIALGSQCDNTSWSQQSMRDFEVCGCGHAILLSYHTKAQEAYFGSTGENIYLAKTRIEMLDMAREILNMSDISRKQLAKKSQQFVYTNHNYRLRAAQIIDAFNTKI